MENLNFEIIQSITGIPMHKAARRVDDPDRSRVSRSQDTTNELDAGIAKPLGDQGGGGAGHRSGRTNTHEEHWPGG